MKNIIDAEFLRVSPERLKADSISFLQQEASPEQITLPRRATSGSAGYDFFAPCSFTVAPGESIVIPTGVRVRMEEGFFLMIAPRSGLGFKYRLRLDNTVGIIDSDYFNAPNEGHILIKLSNENTRGLTLSVRQGEAFAQGIFLPYFIIPGDNTEGIRTGGMGSTSVPCSTSEPGSTSVSGSTTVKEDKQ